MAATPHLGPFALEEELGAGGMGTVFRGRHRQTGVSVALKVMKPGQGPDLRDQFHREVQAQAGLVHPGVVYLYEFGEVDGEAAATSDDLTAGEPFVAMELAEYGTLTDYLPLSDWPTLRRLLLQVLDALGFAHARGVVHRDLKPENILVFETDGAARLKLADFGVAHQYATEETLEAESLSGVQGTPHYMPPEQSRERWRQFGPWTDLYALGCIVWEIVSGRPPFESPSAVQTLLQHSRQERPRLDPTFPVPDALHDWVRRAMAISPEARFRRAADAADALPGADGPAAGLDLANPSGADTETDPFGPTLAPTVLEEVEQTLQLEESADRPAMADTLAPTEVDGELPGDGGSTETGPRAGRTDRTLAADWRVDRSTERPAAIVGTGLGLFGLRRIPFVDRDEERETIWRGLDRVVTDGEFRALLVAGPSGTGKSRLTEWMATRAHEVGAARVLKAVHTPGGGPSDGLPGLICRTFRAWKLDRAELFDHLTDRLPTLDDASLQEEDARALTELVFPTDDEAEPADGPSYRFASPTQKYAVVTRALRRLASRRPVFLRLDDLQWGDEALGLLEHLLDHPDPPAVCLAATVRTEALADRPDLADRLEALDRQDQCRRIDLQPLGPRHHRRLVDRMLPLDDALARRLAERTEGNPLFAAQLLGSLIERGDIEVGADGFALAEGERPTLPDDIHDLWLERLDRLVDGFDAGRRADILEALELAATLGREVDTEEWTSACRRAGVTVPDGLIDRLIDRGLAERDERGWAIAHGMLAESIRRRASEAGRAVQHHRICAETLQQRHADQPLRSAGRRAEHWLAAGERERALQALELQEERFWKEGAYRRWADILDRREELLDELSIGWEDERRVAHATEQARRDFYLRDAETAGERARETLERARRIDAFADMSSLAEILGHCAKRDGQPSEAEEWCLKSVDWAAQSDDSRRHGRALSSLARMKQNAGELAAAEEDYGEAIDRFERAGDDWARLYTTQSLARIAATRGENLRSRAIYEDTREEARESGYRRIEAGCWNGLGSIAWEFDAPDTARRCFERYESICREMGDPEGVGIALLARAETELLAGHFDPIAELLAGAEERFDRLGADDLTVLVVLTRLGAAAGRADWEDFDRHFAPFRDGWPEQQHLQMDAPWLLEMAGDYARQAGADERARRAWRLARRLWQRLDNDEAAARLEERLAE